MKFRLVENIKNNDSYSEFSRIYEKILPVELQYLNQWLDKYGFEVELISDEDYEPDSELKDAVGVFCADIQDIASVFPVFINKENIYRNLKENNLGFETDYSEIKDAIRGTLWHEAGHGIYEYLLDEYDFEVDEEDAAENFARYPEQCELFDALQDYFTQM